MAVNINPTTRNVKVFKEKELKEEGPKSISLSFKIDKTLRKGEEACLTFVLGSKI